MLFQHVVAGKWKDKVDVAIKKSIRNVNINENLMLEAMIMKWVA